MAIRIPSKNIYEIDNPKIIDNIIDNVSVEQTIVKPNNEYEKTVSNLKLTKFFTPTKFTRDFSLYGNIPASVSNYYQRGALVGIKTTDVICASVSIPKTSNNSYITKIFYGLNNEGNPRIKTNIKCEKYEGTLTATLKHKLAPDITTSTHNVFPVTQANIYISYNAPTYNNSCEYLNIEKITNEEIKVSQTTTSVGTNPSVTATVTGVNRTNIGDESVLIEETDTEYKLSFTVLCGYEKYYGQQNEITETPILFLNQSHTVVCKAEKIVPKQVEITIYGNTIGIDLTNGSVTYGSGNKPYSLSGNELLQDNGKSANISLTKNLANNILDQYAKGKETATLLCSISDYYDESGEKVIDTKTNKMSFRLHDEVIPYVYGADGKDKPMSKNQDGSSKVFEVVGSNIIYDGAVWQELTLLEKTQNN